MIYPIKLIQIVCIYIVSKYMVSMVYTPKLWLISPSEPEHHHFLIGIFIMNHGKIMDLPSSSVALYGTVAPV